MGRCWQCRGGSLNHNSISGNIFGQLYLALKSRKCRIFNSDMKLSIPTKNAFVYPDSMVICGEIHLLENRTDVVENPVLVIEVLSKSTAQYDRKEKFELYQTLPSVQEYILIAQDEYRVDLYQKTKQSQWEQTVYQEFTDTLKLNSIGVSIPIEEIYEKIVFLR